MSEPPTIAGRYRFERSLGMGPVGERYAAIDTQDGRAVVLRRIRDGEELDELDELESRLREAARQLEALDHPGAVLAEAVLRDGDDLFVVTPRAEGRPLRALLQAGALPIPLVAEIGRQTADVLARAHALGLVHGDLRPENLLLSTDDGGLSVRVLFGMATLGDVSSTPTREPAERSRKALAPPIGRLQYMAPETIRSNPSDGRSDLYALGVTLYEAAVGRPPFIGEPRAVLDAIERSTPVRPGLLRPDLPQALDLLIVELLTKDPARRKTGASDIAELLTPYADRAVAALLFAEPDRRHQLRGTRERGPDARRKLLAGAVGRDRLLQGVDARLASARAGSQQLVLIAGEFGMGKTTLLEELSLACQERDVELLRTSVSGREGAGRLQPFGELLTAGLARRPHAASELGAEAADLVELFPFLDRDRLSELARDRAPDPALFAGLSTEPAGPRRTRSLSTPEARKLSPRERVDRVVVRAFEALVADGRPLVLAIDDAHLRGDIVEIVERIFRRLPRAPLLIVVTFQLGELGAYDPLRRLRLRLSQHPRCLNLDLEPLDEDAIRSLLVELLGGGRPQAGLVASLHEQSGGRPLFARELVRAAVEHGLVIQRDGVWQLDAANWPIPRSLRAMIAGQLAKLSQPLLSALRTGSVLAVGQGYFDRHEVETLHRQPPAALELMLDKAVRLGMLRERHRHGRQRYAFTSELLRRVIHDDVPHQARRKLHRHHAEQLRRMIRSEDERGLEELMLGHLIAAEALPEAKPLVVALGQRALEAGRPELALPKLTALLEVADALPVIERAQLRLLAAELHVLARDPRAASSALQRLVAALGEDDEPKLALLGERGAELAHALGRPELANRLLGLRPRDRRTVERERRARAEVAALRPASASRSMAIGDLHFMHGEFALAREAYASARQRALAAGDVDEEARQLRRLVAVASTLGHHALALSLATEGLERLAETDTIERIAVLAQLADARTTARDLEGSRTALERAEALLGELDDANPLDVDPADPTDLREADDADETDQADAADAADAGDRATAEAGEADWSQSARARATAALEHARGHWLFARDRAEPAIAAFERCLAAISPDDRWLASNARVALGRACGLAGHTNRALRELERAAIEKQKLGDRWGLARAQTARARVLRDLGRIADATDVIAAVSELADSIAEASLRATVHVEVGRHMLLRGAIGRARDHAHLALDSVQVRPWPLEVARALALLAAIELASNDRPAAVTLAERAVAAAEQHGFRGALIDATLVLAVAGPVEARPALLARARAAAEAHGNPYRSLDVALVGLRLGLGEPDHAGDDYVAIESLSERAEELGAERHFGLCLYSRAEVLAPIDLRSALEHARLAEVRLRRLGAILEADRAGQLAARLALADRARRP